MARRRASAAAGPSQVLLQPGLNGRFLDEREVLFALVDEFGCVSVSRAPGRAAVKRLVLELRRRDLPDDVVDDARDLADHAFGFVLQDEPGDARRVLGGTFVPGKAIALGFRDEAHRAAAAPLLRRLARALGYRTARV